MVSNPYLKAIKRPFGRGITPFRGLTITMVINHLLNGMILQVGIVGLVCFTGLVTVTDSRLVGSLPRFFFEALVPERVRRMREGNPT